MSAKEPKQHLLYFKLPPQRSSSSHSGPSPQKKDPFLGTYDGHIFEKVAIIGYLVDRQSFELSKTVFIFFLVPREVTGMALQS